MDEFVNDEKENKSNHFQSPIFKSIVASSLPTFMLRPFIHPLDVLKIRFQLQKHTLVNSAKIATTISTATTTNTKIIHEQHYKSILHALKLICHEEGCQSLMRGLFYSQNISVLSSILQFTVYGKFRKFLHHSNISESAKFNDFMAGYLTGTTTSIILNPFDLVRAQLLARQYNSTIGLTDIVRNVYNYGGIKQFFSGAGTGMWHAGTLNGLRFMFYNASCEIAMKYEHVSSHKQLKAGEMFLAGIVSGIFSNVLAYPLEVIKRRLQTAHMNIRVESGVQNVKGVNVIPQKLANSADVCKEIVQCILLTVRMEGPMAFYKGFTSSALKSIISTAIQLSCYDLVYRWIDDIFK